MDRSSDLDALSVEDEEKRQQEDKKLVRYAVWRPYGFFDFGLCLCGGENGF